HGAREQAQHGRRLCGPRQPALLHGQDHDGVRRRQESRRRHREGASLSARDRILARIRKAQGRGESGPSQAELEAVETYLRAHPRGTLPPVDADLVARFRARAESMQSTTEEIATEADVPAAVARYLKAGGLPLAGCAWPQLADLDWRSAGLAVEPRAGEGDDAVGVTGGFAAIAETGTLMRASGADTPASLSRGPETHVAVVSADRIVAH